MGLVIARNEENRLEIQAINRGDRKGHRFRSSIAATKIRPILRLQ
jgi:hypothetical protein